MMAGAILKARTLWAHIYTNVKVEVLVTLSRPPLCDPRNHSPPGSSVHAVLQARILEWAAISFSRDLPDPVMEPRSLTLQADSLPFEPPGKPYVCVYIIYTQMIV